MVDMGSPPDGKTDGGPERPSSAEARDREPLSRFAPDPSCVFFSYSRKDAEFALRLARDLRQAGIKIWIDQLDIPAGARWDQQIEQALRVTRNTLVILSPSAVTSHNVLDEISYAIDDGDTIIPVMYRPCKVPLRLGRIQYLDFTGDYATALVSLIERFDRASSRDSHEPLVGRNSGERSPSARGPGWLLVSLRTRAILVGLAVAGVSFAGLWTLRGRSHQASPMPPPTGEDKSGENKEPRNPSNPKVVLREAPSETVEERSKRDKRLLEMGVRWVDFGRERLSGAYSAKDYYSAGYQQEMPLLLCRRQHEGQLHVGKVVAERCNIPIAGRNEGREDNSRGLFEVLRMVASRELLTWQRVEGGQIEAEAPLFNAGTRDTPVIPCCDHIGPESHPGQVDGEDCLIPFKSEVKRPRPVSLVLSWRN